jgi:hypothetical protein
LVRARPRERVENLVGSRLRTESVDGGGMRIESMT